MKPIYADNMELIKRLLLQGKTPTEVADTTGAHHSGFLNAVYEDSLAVYDHIRMQRYLNSRWEKEDRQREIESRVQRVLTEDPDERWEHIEGTEHHMISSKARVINCKTARLLKPCLVGVNHSPNGYLYVWITENAESVAFSLSRMVAEAFIPNPEGKPQVNHIKGEPHVLENNFVEHLEWVTPAENMHHAEQVLGVDLTATRQRAWIALRQKRAANSPDAPRVEVFNLLMEGKQHEEIAAELGIELGVIPWMVKSFGPSSQEALKGVAA